jgi:hypothetical protein
MRSKLLTGGVAIAITACSVLANVSTASAQSWRGHRGGWGWGAPAAIAAGVVGGAVAAATSPLWAPGYYGYPGYYGGYGGGYYDYAPGYAGYYDYSPGYAYEAAPAVAQGPAVADNDPAYCQARFRSYNPATGMYLGFDGQYHPCP